MQVRQTELDTRPAGTGILSSESDEPVLTPLRKGWIATLRHHEVRINVQILEIEEDNWFLGQVVDFEGLRTGEHEGLRIGSFIRFREQNVFSCHRGA